MASNDVPSAGERVHFDKAVPDLVGEELGDKAQIWLEYERAARDDDRDRIGNWNRGLDNLALFAGLLSAVTTTFIIESQHDSQPDYARLTFLVLNATASGIPFAQEPFVIDSNVRLINCVWITSLMLSLAAALIAVVGKDWVAMYASRPGCNPRQWAEIRTYRLACINRWHMSGVLTSAPVLLHMSLILFFVGLVLFTSPDPVLQRVALWLAIAIGVLDLTTMLSAIIFPASPFKSPATQAVRRSLVPTCTSLRRSCSSSWQCPGTLSLPAARVEQLVRRMRLRLPLDLLTLDRRLVASVPDGLARAVVVASCSPTDFPMPAPLRDTTRYESDPASEDSDLDESD